MTVEGFIELRPHGGRAERVFATAGGAPVPVLDGAVEVRLLPAGEGGVVSESGGGELLAARLEIARLRDGLRDAQGAICNGFCAGADAHRGYCTDIDTLLSAPPPPIAELRELVAAVKVEIDEWIESGDGEGGKGFPPERLGDAYAAVLAAYPGLAKD